MPYFFKTLSYRGESVLKTLGEDESWRWNSDRRSEHDPENVLTLTRAQVVKLGLADYLDVPKNFKNIQEKRAAAGMHESADRFEQHSGRDGDIVISIEPPLLKTVAASIRNSERVTVTGSDEDLVSAFLTAESVPSQALMDVLNEAIYNRYCRYPQSFIDRSQTMFSVENQQRSDRTDKIFKKLGPVIRKLSDSFVGLHISEIRQTRLMPRDKLEQIMLYLRFYSFNNPVLAEYVSKLELDDMGIGPQNIGQLNQILSYTPNLRVLNLYKNAIGASGVRDLRLAYLSSLQRLKLGRNAIDPAILQWLKDRYPDVNIDG